MTTQTKPNKEQKRLARKNYMKNHFSLYTMVLPGFLLILVFSYFPMYGIVMAFQDFKPGMGFFGSPWAQPFYKHFSALVKDPYFPRIFKNTLILGLQSLFFTFPAPIILALLFNEMKHNGYKRVAQTISYMPYFLSTVIVVGIMREMLSVNDGVVNHVIQLLGLEPINFFAKASAFRPMYILSGIWQGVGYSSIIYLAAIAGINPELYEAAIIDGAGRFQQMRHITLPSIMETAIILLLFSMGGIIGNDYQKILLMYSPTTYSTADVINTYVYRMGIEGASQSYTAAVGLFTSVISFALLFLSNGFAKKAGETSLW